MNYYLRKGINANQTQDMESLLNHALQKMPLSSGTQYRAINLPDSAILNDFLDIHNASRLNKTPQLYNDYISAADDLSNITKYWRKSNIRITIENPTNARDISDLAVGVNFHETLGVGPNYVQESLFPNRSSFDVMDIQGGMDNGRDIYYLILKQR